MGNANTKITPETELTISKGHKLKTKKTLISPDAQSADVFPTTVFALESGDQEERGAVVKIFDSTQITENKEVTSHNLFQIEYENKNFNTSSFLSCGKCQTFKEIENNTRTRVKDIHDKVRSDKLTHYEANIIIDNQRLFAYRPYAPDTLASRLHRAPALNDADKLWIAYRIIAGLAALHAKKFYHGCVKPENVLIWPGNRATLADPGLIHPVSIPADNPSFFIRIFKGGSATGCFLAPERVFFSDDRRFQNDLEEKMDVFAAGCVVAYLFLNGRFLFDYASLAAYKRGEKKEQDSLDALVGNIRCEFARKLVTDMIKVKPKDRPTAEMLLARFPEWLKSYDAATGSVDAAPNKVLRSFCKKAAFELLSADRQVSASRGTRSCNVSPLTPVLQHSPPRAGGAARGPAEAVTPPPQPPLQLPASSLSLQQQQQHHHDQTLTVKRRQTSASTVALPTYTSDTFIGTANIASAASAINITDDDTSDVDRKGSEEASLGEGVLGGKEVVTSLLLIGGITGHIAKCDDRATLVEALDTLYRLAQRVPDGDTKVAAVFPYLWHHAVPSQKGKPDSPWSRALRAHALRLSASLLQSVPALHGTWRRVVPNCVLPGLMALVESFPERGCDALTAVALAETLPAFAEAGARFYLSGRPVPLSEHPEHNIHVIRRKFELVFRDLVEACIHSPAAQVAVVESAPLMAATVGCSSLVLNIFKGYMNSQSPRVREAVARMVPALAPVLGPLLVEEELLQIVADLGVYDREPRVVAASLDAIAALCGLGVLRRKTLAGLWRRCLCAALLPSMWVRFAAIGAVTAICEALGPVDTALVVDFAGSGLADNPGRVKQKSLERALRARVSEGSVNKALDLIAKNADTDQLATAEMLEIDVPKIKCMWDYLTKRHERSANLGPEKPPPPPRKEQSQKAISAPKPMQAQSEMLQMLKQPSPDSKQPMSPQSQSQQPQVSSQVQSSGFGGFSSNSILVKKKSAIKPQQSQGNSSTSLSTKSSSSTTIPSSFSSSSFSSSSSSSSSSSTSKGPNEGGSFGPAKILKCVGGPAARVCTAGNLVVSASRDGKLCVWNMASAASEHGVAPPLRHIDAMGPVQSLALDRDGRAFCGMRGLVRVWDVQSEVKHDVSVPFGSGSSGASLGRAPEDVVAVECWSQGVWCGLRCGTLRFLDLQQQRPVTLTLRGDAGCGLLTAIATIPGKGLLVTGTSRGHMTLWDVRKEVPVARWWHPTRSRIRGLAALCGDSNDDNLLVTVAGPSSVLCWDYTDAGGEKGAKIVAGFYSPIGDPRDAKGNAKDEFTQILAENFDTKKEYETAASYVKPKSIYWAKQTAVCASRSGDKNLCFFTGGIDSQVRRWSVRNPNLQCTLGYRDPAINPQVGSWIISNSNAQATGIGKSGPVLNVTAANIRTPEKFYYRRGVLDVCLTDDGTKCLAAYGDGVIRVWDVNTK